MELLKRFKLQNLVLQSDSLSGENSAMLYRGANLQYNPIISAYLLNDKDFTEFFTYFNSFSYEKWKKYTKAGKIYLSIRVKGTFTIQLFGHFRQGGAIGKEFYPLNHYSLKEYTDIDIPVPDHIQGSVLGFQITAEKNFCIQGGGWYTDVKDSDIKPVHISIATTTFKKESYIKRNVDIMERELFYSDEPCREHYHLRIIDNGRTLDPDDFNSEYITLYPNINAGGAGGFTRGMLESLRAEKKPTHVLLMDDDVTISTEAFVRTYSLLALLKEEYTDCFLSGAMLYYESMNIQHEDVGYVHSDGSYGPNKPIMDMNLWNNVFENEQFYSFHTDSYAGWWYCCIPSNMIDINQLPVPLFIRGDDVEFSVKRNARFLTLSGICIWHKGFVDKFNASLELYLVHRNSLVIQAISGILQDKDFVERIDEFFESNLRRLSYGSCELLLDAIEDYLKGPEFLMTPQGEQILREKSAKNEQLIELSQACHNIKEMDIDTVLEKLYEEAPLKGLMKFLYERTYNFQLAPKFFLKKKTAAIPYDWLEVPAKNYRCEQLLAVNKAGHTANLRVRSRRRCLDLLKRRKKLLKQYRRQSKTVAEKYRKAGETFGTEKFWREYLGV